MPHVAMVERFQILFLCQMKKYHKLLVPKINLHQLYHLRGQLLFHSDFE